MVPVYEAVEIQGRIWKKKKPHWFTSGQSNVTFQISRLKSVASAQHFYFGSGDHLSNCFFLLFHSPFRPPSPFCFLAFSFFQCCGVSCLGFLSCLGWEELLNLIFYHRLGSITRISNWSRLGSPYWVSARLDEDTHTKKNKAPKNKAWSSIKRLIALWALCKSTSHWHHITLYIGSNIHDRKFLFLCDI